MSSPIPLPEMQQVTDFPQADILQHTEPRPRQNLWETFKTKSTQPYTLQRRESTIARREKKKARQRLAVKNYFLGLFPPLQWVPLYFYTPKQDVETGKTEKVTDAFVLESWKKRLIADVIAGIQVALMVVPQGLAYASLASLPPVMGLYSTLMGMLVYAFFGTSRELSVAPVAVNALLVTSTLSNFADPVTQTDLYVQYVLVTTFFTGIFSLGFGMLNLGYAVTFVSNAVILGFTTGSAFVIMVSQLETLFGFSTEKSDYAIVTLVRFFANITKTKWVALLIGIVSLAIMEGVKRIPKPWAKYIPRPLLVVVIATVMSYLFTTFAPQFPVPIVGTVPRGLPPISIPQLSNSSMVLNSLMPAFLLTIIGFLQSIAVTLRFSEQRAYKVRPSQELNALGLAHIVVSFFTGFDVTGGFSRTAVSVSVGTVSQISGLITTLGVLISVVGLTPLFYYMPKSALAAIIISAVIPLTDFDAYKRLWKRGQTIDLSVAIGTALITFFVTAQVGIGIGVLVSLLGILYTITRPHSAVLGKVVVQGGAEKGLDELEHDGEEEKVDNDETLTAWRNVKRYQTQQVPGVMIFRFDARLWFANSVYFREQCLKVVRDPDEFGYKLGEEIIHLILDFSSVNSVDDVGFGSLVSLRNTLRDIDGIELLLVNVKGPIRDVLWRSTDGFTTKGSLSKEMFYRDVDDAIQGLNSMNEMKASRGETSEEGNLIGRVDRQASFVCSVEQATAIALDQQHELVA